MTLPMTRSQWNATPTEYRLGSPADGTARVLRRDPVSGTCLVAVTVTPDIAAAAPTVATTIARQIGHANILAISGGRIDVAEDGIVLPVRYGYTVEVHLCAGADTYTVRRVHTRAGRRTIKGELADVYAEELGDAAYRASCYREPFGS